MQTPDTTGGAGVSANDHPRGLLLQRATIAWNSGEVFVTVALGLAAGSFALVAFGLDSLIEVFTSVVVLQHMGERRDDTEGLREARALRLIGWAFALLSVFLIVAATRGLVAGVDPDPSPVGIIYLSATALVMFALAAFKRRTGRLLNSPIFLSEARMTQLDAYLSTGILGALVANAAWGWWWTDPIAVGAVAIVAAGEAHGLLSEQR